MFSNNWTQNSLAQSSESPLASRSIAGRSASRAPFNAGGGDQDPLLTPTRSSNTVTHISQPRRLYPEILGHGNPSTSSLPPQRTRAVTTATTTSSNSISGRVFARSDSEGPGTNPFLAEEGEEYVTVTPIRPQSNMRGPLRSVPQPTTPTPQGRSRPPATTTRLPGERSVTEPAPSASRRQPPLPRLGSVVAIPSPAVSRRVSSAASTAIPPPSAYNPLGERGATPITTPSSSRRSSIASSTATSPPQTPIARRRPSILPSGSSTSRRNAATNPQLLAAIGSLNNETHNVAVDWDRKATRVPGMTVDLRPHQIAGTTWMRMQEQNEGRKGGFIADEMGTGKTAQVIARIVESKKEPLSEEVSNPTLIIVPANIKSQWRAEINRMAPGLRVLECSGIPKIKDATDFEIYDAVIVSYDKVRVEYTNYKQEESIEEDGEPDSDEENSPRSPSPSPSVIFSPQEAHQKNSRSPLFRIIWRRIVLDEAHYIKTWKSKRSIACRKLDAEFRWLLTGTPINNYIHDLFPYLVFLKVKAYEKKADFDEKIARPMTKGEFAGPMRILHRLFDDWMIRRIKSTMFDGAPILVLPPKIIKDIRVTLSPAERDFYEYLLARFSSMAAQLEQEGIAGDKYSNFLVWLLRLRQTCDHFELVAMTLEAERQIAQERMLDVNANDEDKARKARGGSEEGVCTNCRTNEDVPKGKRMCRTCDRMLQAARKAAVQAVTQKAILNTGIPPSAKIFETLRILDEVDAESDGQDKTIIFSQWTSMLDIIEPYLLAKNIGFTRFDGKMSMSARERALNSIRTDRRTRVILISLHAGGLGLNLPCCNRVILLDPWWNPFIEEQGFDRAHRFGQTKQVTVYKLIAAETIEEDFVLKLQKEKRKLANAALKDGEEYKDTRLTLENILEYFKSHPARKPRKWDEQRGRGQQQRNGPRSPLNTFGIS